MKRHPKYKHDIAISVAEEDLPIAKQIAAALAVKNISYFLYTEHRARNWGKHILKISLDAYGAEAMFVLMITSKIFIDKYWVNIEKQISEVFNKGKQPYILQLRIDNTPVDGLSKNVVSEKWENNPYEIAEIIKEKLKLRNERKLPLWKKQNKWLLIPIAIILGSMVLIFNNSYRDDRHSESGQNARQNDTPVTKQVSGKSEISKQDIRTPGSISNLQDANNKITQIFIKGGSFTMGNIGGRREEQPPHIVTVNAFFISPTEVTVAQYRSFCSSQGKALPAQPVHRLPDSCPIVNITWDEAIAYCRWAKGRLPTEAEWEYAAGGGMAVKYSGSNNASKVAVYGGNNLSKVATKQPNNFGLYDMTGNVAEWCSDWFDSTYYATSQSNNPPGPLTGKEKVIRGGAFFNKVKPVNELHIAYRNKELPNSRKLYIGFRVVWDKEIN
ncbi:MAG TPA: SUMF1/EgtB/PvdO family nonheme iron enzyme [Chitinophagaceae bacterium]|nr:SUMF1/EgtB/PvdO family nonheme iron enzyme [Chitinophagaceae bacterium]